MDDWKDWKINLLRFLKLGIFNFLLLFVMGYQAFWDFIGSVSAQLSRPGWEWNGNHTDTFGRYYNIARKHNLLLLRMVAFATHDVRFSKRTSIQ